jgi:uncharacterized protein (TIGR02145 family)
MRIVFSFLILSFCFFEILSAQSITDVESIIDSRDGQEYKTVRIGDKSWMLENLNYSSKSGSWCYDENVSNCDLYGRLYDWQTAKNVCPHGWHLPAESDFDTLLTNIGGSEDNAYNSLKEGGGSGFSALLGGWKYYYEGFYNIGSAGSWWSSTEREANEAWGLSLDSESQTAFMGNYTMDYGFSVRCIKN